MAFCYEYPRPALTVDCIICCREKNSFRILLIRRKNQPFKQKWALPGGFVGMDELLVNAAARELEEETGLSRVQLEFMGIFDKPGRDPRGRTISVVYKGDVGMAQPTLKAGSDAAEAKWFKLGKLPSMAFDHREILETAFSKPGITED